MPFCFLPWFEAGSLGAAVFPLSTTWQFIRAWDFLLFLPIPPGTVGIYYYMQLLCWGGVLNSGPHIGIASAFHPGHLPSPGPALYKSCSLCLLFYLGKETTASWGVLSLLCLFLGPA